jgi:isochorismate synthase
MDQPLLRSKLNDHYSAGLPFVTFRLPHSDIVFCYFQKDTSLHSTTTFKEESFIFAPFDFSGAAHCIPSEASEVVKFKMPSEISKQSVITIPEDDSEKIRYTKLVGDAIEKIRTGNVKKIVLSRPVEIELKKFDLSAIFSRVMGLYPSALSYIWYHPHTGLWSGASPEVLIYTEDSSFTTMALAGTQKAAANGINHWSVKEMEEQQYVTDAITTSLQKITAVLKVSKTTTHRAGTLAHLRTDITGILKSSKATLPKVCSVLHPTPAVCGTPRENARNFIRNREGYDRDYYSGFLGPVCEDHRSSNLFVNLRCMQVDGSKARLYVGGGITQSSDPVQEWEETQNKLQTMLQVLAPML